MKTIHDLYYGKFQPPSNSVSPDSEYEQLLRRLQTLDDAFCSGLSTEQRAQYRRITDLHGQMTGLVVADNYVQGFRDGASVILDVVYGKNENLQ